MEGGGGRGGGGGGALPKWGVTASIQAHDNETSVLLRYEIFLFSFLLFLLLYIFYIYYIYKVLYHFILFFILFFHLSIFLIFCTGISSCKCNFVHV